MPSYERSVGPNSVRGRHWQDGSIEQSMKDWCDTNAIGLIQSP